MGNSIIHHTPSALEKFSLGYEFDMSWHEARKAVKKRTHK